MIENQKKTTEVPDSDTTSVDVEVGDDEDTVVLEDLVSSGSDGTIGSLGDDLGFDLTSVTRTTRV